MKLDFSEFHPLDHNLLQCRRYPGGWRRHLSHRWEFMWEPTIRKHTACRIGRHHWSVWRTRDGRSGVLCWHCQHAANVAQTNEVMVRYRERGMKSVFD